MNPQNPIPPAQRIHNPLEVMQSDEQIICEIERHPAGMLGVYIIAGFFLLLIAVFTFVIIPGAFTGGSNLATTIGVTIFVAITAAVLIFVFIVNKIFLGNKWVVTSDSLTQISQATLFNKQSSQLSLGNLEDVTSEKRGVLAQMFGYGTLKAETAGERSKFVFHYCPRPDYYAQKILAAREAFEQAHHGGKQEPYNGQPATPMQSSQQPFSEQQPFSGQQPSEQAEPQATEPTVPQSEFDQQSRPDQPQAPPIAPPGTGPVFPDTPYSSHDDSFQ